VFFSTGSIALSARRAIPAAARRSEDLIRDSLVAEEWETTTSEMVGAITIVYSHDKRELTDTLTDLQHRYYHSIISSMHIHLDEHNCLEVVVVRGKARNIKTIADRLIGTKGVKHGRLSLTTTGKHLK
jgi:CopG family nickel-responsive transcriptional regulator